MLFAIAAVLTTSVVFAPVATEAIVVPSSVAPQHSVPAPLTGPQPTTPPELLRSLGMLAPAALTDYLVKHPLAVDQLIANPPSGAEVRSWWRATDAAQRNTLLKEVPRLIGSLEGIPYELRDRVNRRLLAEASAELRTENSDGRTVSNEVRSQLRMLTAVQSALETDDGQARSLLTLDLEGQGRAAIVIGDLRTADYVSYLVPGMLYTVEGQLGDWVDAAARLHADECAWLTRLGDSDSEVATIAWIGYHTPDLTTVLGFDRAREGAEALTDAITGLQSMRVDDPPFVSVVAHSYGSTAALVALTNGDLSIDALAIVGSPGSPVKSVSELNVPDDEVYVGGAIFDPIPMSAYFGPDPRSESFGAKSLGVAGGGDPITGTSLGVAFGHNDYFGSGTEAMRNFALVAIDRGDLVSGD